jgi:hypothetical protein
MRTLLLRVGPVYLHTFAALKLTSGAESKLFFRIPNIRQEQKEKLPDLNRLIRLLS